MTALASITLEVPDPAATSAMCAALGVDHAVAARRSQAPTSGFRGFAVSLVVSQPSTVDSLLATAVDHGATTLKPAKLGFWGYGGTVQALDGTIWMAATSAKRDSGPATRHIDDIVLLLGVADVRASKRSYVDRGLTVQRSFGGKYVEFAADGSGVRLSLYGRRGLARQAGVSPEGGGSHRVVLHGDTASFTDPDGFAWETVPQRARAGG